MGIKLALERLLVRLPNWAMTAGIGQKRDIRARRASGFDRNVSHPLGYPQRWFFHISARPH
jgi:hypothetical protein